MKFILDAESYSLIKKYVDFSELSYVAFNDNSYELQIKKHDLELFLLIVSEASTTYGLDSDGEITPFGRKLETIYDTLYAQVK